MSVLQIYEEIGIKNKEFCDFACATDSLKRHSCKKCDYSSHLKVYFAKHKHGWKKQKSVEKPIKYSCGKCRKFSSYSQVVYMKHEFEECKIQEFLEEQKRPSKIKEFCCPHCTHKATLKANLLIHINAKHKSPEEAKWFKCDQCDYKSKYAANLLRHQKFRHCSLDMVSLKCDLCPHETKFKYYLEQHVKEAHANPMETGWFQCEQCPYRGKHNRYLVRHVKYAHTGPRVIKWLQCEHCLFITKGKSYLKSHVRSIHKTLKRSG